MLEESGIDRAVMESRNPIQDSRDIQMVNIMKSGGILKALNLCHVRGELEPRLWFPDLILGAYGDVLTGDSLPKAWIDALESVEDKTVFHVISV